MNYWLLLLGWSQGGPISSCRLLFLLFSRKWELGLSPHRRCNMPGPENRNQASDDWYRVCFHTLSMSVTMALWNGETAPLIRPLTFFSVFFSFRSSPCHPSVPYPHSNHLSEYSQNETHKKLKLLHANFLKVLWRLMNLNSQNGPVLISWRSSDQSALCTSTTAQFLKLLHKHCNVGTCSEANKATRDH